MVEIRSLAVVGLGKLGAPTAAVFAKKGFDTVGVDLNPALVSAVNAGRAPVEEPHLQATMNLGRGRLRATSDFRDGIGNSDASFIIVPTPSGDDHTFSNTHLFEAIDQIGESLRVTGRAHLVVVVSTVMPGTMDFVRQRLEQRSGRITGDKLGLCYCPEFVALGSVVEDLLHPDLVLIGESDARAGEALVKVHKRVVESQPEFHRMNFVNAELCKIALNTFVTTKITYANMIADLCDHIPGADCDVVTQALGADSRVGKKYLRGAVGYGGPCFPRDNKALAAFARRVGANSELADATDRVNDHQVERLARIIGRHAAPKARVAVLGLSYKPNTAVIEGSQGVALAHHLTRQGYDVRVTDPQALDAAAIAALGGAIRSVSTMREALAEADVAVIMTPWPEFKDVDLGAGPLTIIDPWRLIDHNGIGDNITLVIPGRHTTLVRSP